MNSDRNLLFGVLALQADLIEPDQFARVCSDWAAKKGTPLADLLQERGWISAEDRVDVEKLLERKLHKHGGDVHASLAAAADDHVRSLIRAADDPDLRRSIADLPPAGRHTLISTVSYQPETRERYTLSRLHAQGGLGQVWLALDGDLGRQVALKELRPERSADPALSARFLEEAKVTGQLEHPGIAPVYELSRRGADGQPFYTMRFIKGRTLAEAIKDYHRKREAGETGPLDLSTLLNAVVGVCNAVAYAHSRKVIHRDLKPQNVVLGDYGEVILLDWGLAKLVDRPEGVAAMASVALDTTDGREATVQGQVLGTPAYMPPEQAEGGVVDHRSDVYGLGAILYEVLTGRPPFQGSDTRELLRQVVAEVTKRPREVVPGTPRALEAICLKALSKLPAERYGSAADLASELRHYLADEPVTAYREPVAALAGRWVRRHRTFVAGSAVLIVTLLAASAAGLLLLGQKNREIAAERNAARAAADQARAVNDFLTEDLLGQADPDLNDRDQKITVEALLHRAAVKLDQSSTFAGQPEVEATLRMTLGKTLFKLSDLAGAEVHLRRAVELRHEALGPNDPLTLTAREALADFLNRGPGRFDESLTLSRETWEARSRVLGPEHRDTLDSLDTYATALMASGRLDEAIPFQRQCLEARRSVLGPTHAETLTSMSNLATTLMKRGVWSEAIPLLQEVLAARSSSNSESRLAVTASNLAICLYMNGDLEEANRLLSDALGRVGQPLGDHQETDRLRWLQVRVWIDQGRTEEAIALALEALPLRRRIYPAGNSMIGQALMDRGRGLVILKQFVEAETDLTESLAIFAKAAPFLPHFPGWAECWLGASLAGQGRHTEAERHLLAAEKKLREAPTTPRRHYVMCAEQLVKLYESWGKPDQAAKWRDLLTPAGGKSSKSP